MSLALRFQGGEEKKKTTTDAHAFNIQSRHFLPFPPHAGSIKRRFWRVEGESGRERERARKRDERRWEERETEE